jgi:ribosome-binding factor A
MSLKSERTSDILIEQISYIIAKEVKNKDINFVTITDVKVTNDLSFAKVYFTVLDEDKKQSTLKALKSATGFIRHMLRERVDLRQIPELRFVYDESIEYGEKIENIIEKIHESDK